MSLGWWNHQLRRVWFERSPVYLIFVAYSTIAHRQTAFPSSTLIGRQCSSAEAPQTVLWDVLLTVGSAGHSAVYSWAIASEPGCRQLPSIANAVYADRLLLLLPLSRSR